MDGDEECSLLISNRSDVLNINDAEYENNDGFEPAIYQPAVVRTPYIPPAQDPMSARMRYYNRLAQNTQKLIVPAHVIPAELVTNPLPFIDLTGDEEEGDSPKKIGSLTVIFSIWNTMMGSSLLAIPWGMSEAGIAVGLIITFLIGLVCCYTCVLVIWWGKGSDDLFYVCQRYLGQPGKILCWAASLMLLVGSTFAYNILMIEVFYSIIYAILQLCGITLDSDSYYWNMYYAAAIVITLMFPVTMLKSVGFLVKFNTLGIISVFYTVTFIIVYCLFWKGLDFDGVPLKEDGFFALAGMLSVSFFIHSLILPILKNTASPEHNVRDVTIGYLLVGLCYGFVGAIGYLAYWSEFPDDTFPQEFLQAFDYTNIGALAARVFLFFQLCTVFPLLLIIIRIQFFGLLWASDYPGFFHVLVHNIVIIGTGTTLAIYAPDYGTILSYTGAVCGVVLVFILPILIHLIGMKKETGSWGWFRLPFHILIMITGLCLSIGQFIP